MKENIKEKELNKNLQVLYSLLMFLHVRNSLHVKASDYLIKFLISLYVNNKNTYFGFLHVNSLNNLLYLYFLHVKSSNLLAKNILLQTNTDEDILTNTIIKGSSLISEDNIYIQTGNLNILSSSNTNLIKNDI